MWVGKTIIRRELSGGREKNDGSGRFDVAAYQDLQPCVLPKRLTHHRITGSRFNRIGGYQKEAMLHFSRYAKNFKGPAL